MSAKTQKTIVLDLDKFEGDVLRTITIKGQAYPVVEMSVENFIETTREAQRLDADPKVTMADHIESTVQMILRSVPTAPVDELRSMSLVKLGVIVKFLQGDMDDQIAKAAEDAEKAGDTEVAKK